MVGFDHKQAVRLGGKTAKEKTKEELLAEVRAERAARGDAKRRTAAALTIQRYWRGYACRRATRAQLLSWFTTTYSPLVANQQAQVSTEQLVKQLVPTALFLLGVGPGQRSKQPPQQGGPAASASAGRSIPSSAGGTAAPLVLLPSGFSTKAVAAVSAAAASGATSLPAKASSPSLLPVARCLLALLMRSCSSSASSSCCLALGVAPGIASEEVVRRWQRQAPQLLRVCCCLVCCPGGDALVDAAAVRLLGVMTDATQWKCGDAGIAEARGAAAAALRLSLATDPWPLLSALLRCTQAATAAPASPPASTAASASSAPQASPASSPQQQPAPAKPPAPAAASPAAQMVKLQALVSAVLSEGLGAMSGPQASVGSANGGAVIAACAQMLLQGPGSVEQLVDVIQVQLRSPAAATSLCRAMTAACNDLASRASRARSSAAVAAAAAQCLSGVANLTQLLVGCRTAKTGGAVLPSLAQQAAQLAALPVVQPEAAASYSIAASELLARASRLLSGLGPTPSTLSTPSHSSPHLNTASSSTSSAAVAAVASEGGKKAAAAAALDGEAASAVAAAAAAVGQLWPLGQRGFLMQLLDSLEQLPGGKGMEVFAAMCDTAMRCLPEISKALTRAGHPPPGTPNVLNTLAFSPRLLPRLWRWLGPALGLPLEAPISATRGLDVASLAHGFRDIPRPKALVLGLFCRLFHHLLLVLDDEELYTQQQPITLAQARAIATSLNSLVFHTYLPKQNGGAVSTSGATSLDEAPPLLAEYAPLLLRSLYERDVRRSFCQPLLWLAPYQETFGSESTHASAAAPSPSSAFSRSELSLPAFLEAAFSQQLFGGPATPPPASAADAVIGNFNAAAIVQTLTPAGAPGSADDSEALKARAGEGSRPASLASVLRTAPQAVPFAQRVELFRALLEEDKRLGGFDRPPYEGGVPPVKLTAHRSSLMEDAFRGLSHLGPALKARLSVTFINEQGLSEAGLDYGGLMKELLEEVVKRGFNPDFGLFVATDPDGLIYPRPSAERVEQGVQLLEFLGLMVGKALYEGILVNLALAPFFCARLQGRTPMFDDLATLDPALHRSLMQVKRYDGDLEDLSLSFCVEDDFFGVTMHHDLLPGGSDIPVTADNRLLYCHLLADWHLNVRLGRAAEAFARGLAHLIPAGAFRLFNPKELNQLLSGGSDDGTSVIDIEDLKRYVRYSGGYAEDSATIKLFWKVVSEMSPKEMGLLLKFITSCSRAPLGGFKYLHPPLTLHKVDCDASVLAMLGGKDVDRLPSASTCYNMLKLPNYRRASTLKSKLLYAISSGAGFELS